MVKPLERALRQLDAWEGEIPKDRFELIRKRVKAEVDRQEKLVLSWARQEEAAAAELESALPERFNAQTATSKSLIERIKKAKTSKEMDVLRKELHNERRSMLALAPLEERIAARRATAQLMRDDPIAYADHIQDKLPASLVVDPLQDDWEQFSIKGKGVGDASAIPADIPKPRRQ